MTQQMNLQRGLVGHWTMDDEDTEGSTLYDNSAYDNHGTLQNSPTTGVTGQVGEAYSFDGTNEVQLSQDASLEPDNLTIVAWVNDDGDDGTRHRILDYNDGSALEHGYRLSIDYQADSGLRFGIGNSGTGSFASNNYFPEVGTWKMIVATFDGSDLLLYDWPTQIAGSTATGVTYTTINVTSIANNALAGDADEVRIYNRVLSNSEINQLYQMREQRHHYL